MKKILVVGSTGLQGKFIVKELLDKGFAVRALVRPNSSQVSKFAQMNVELATGDLFDEESLYQAMQGIDGMVFIPVIPSSQGTSYEVQIGKNVITAAQRANVPYLLHTSVDRAGEHEQFVHWDNMLNKDYWIAKAEVIKLIKNSTIPHWTVLKPVFLMDSFLPPKAIGMYPNLPQGEMVTARNPETKLGVLSAEDLAKVTAQAFLNFEKLDGQEVPLASDYLTTDEIAEAISQAIDKTVKVVYKTPEALANDDYIESQLQALYKDMNFTGRITASMADGLIWDNTDGYTADVAQSNSFGVKLMTFKEWCKRHKVEFSEFIKG